MSARVLVYDRDARTRRALRFVLRGAGFAVDVTATADEALDRAAVHPPDAAVLEFVPGGEGVELCRALRGWSAMPLLALAVAGDTDEGVWALAAGADDYITKPFAPRELVARLRANLRRAKRRDGEPRIHVDGLEVDFAARVVRRDGVPIHLTPIEFKLLHVLLRHRGRLLTHGALLTEVWGAAYLHDIGTLRTHIANLRRKIEPASGARLIRTDHGVGYRFTAAPARAAPPRLVAVEGQAA
jgi:two-component system, OmpR family, KDP operon response regulator KdpE